MLALRNEKHLTLTPDKLKPGVMCNYLTKHGISKQELFSVAYNNHGYIYLALEYKDSTEDMTETDRKVVEFVVRELRKKLDFTYRS